MPGFVIPNPELSPAGPRLETSRHHPGNRIELGRAHRWLVRVYGLLGAEQDLAAYAKTVGRPEFAFDKITVHQGQNEIYLPGKYRWSPIDIEFYELFSDTDQQDFTEAKSPGETSNVISSILRKWWSEVTASYLTHRIRTGAGKNRVDIYMTDGRGVPHHVYRLSGAWPMSVKGSPLDYTSSELSTVTLTLAFDGVEEHTVDDFINVDGGQGQ